MKIGIDAKWYFTGPPSTRAILQNLLPVLFKTYPEHEWVIFLDRKDIHYAFPFIQKNIRTIYVWANNNMLSNLLILPKLIRKSGINVMVFQTFPSFNKNINSIAFIHDILFCDFPQFFTWKERLYFSSLRWLTQKANRLITTSQLVAKDLVRHHFIKDISQIDIVTLGVSANYKPIEQHDGDKLQDVKKKFLLPDSYILYVGRLHIRKNISNLLKAILLLNNTSIGLVIAGKEDGKSVDLKSILSDQKIKSRVIMTGHISNEELTAVYAMAKVFCFPSFAEGFGLPPLEAMASGVPVIVSNNTSLPEVCGDAAVYIDPAKPENIAQALNDLLENPVLYLQKKKAGLEHAAMYNWNITAKLFMHSLMNTLKK